MTLSFFFFFFNILKHLGLFLRKQLWSGGTFMVDGLCCCCYSTFNSYSLLLVGYSTKRNINLAHKTGESVMEQSRKGGGVGNTIINTKGKTVVPLFSVCNKYTGVTWPLKIHDRHIKPQKSADTCIFCCILRKEVN